MKGHWYETAFGALYPVLYRHRDEDEARGAVTRFADVFAPGGCVLDVACGAGRYLGALAEAGVDAVGTDLSQALLAEAVQAHPGRVARADMRRLPVRDASVATVISMFTSFGYFESDDENFGVLREVSRVLRPGGTFLFDFLNATAITAEPPGNSVREQSGYRIVEERALSHDGRFLTKRVSVESVEDRERLSYVERVRLFRPGELSRALEAAGLSVRGRYGDYERSEFDEGASPRLIHVCERPPGK